MTCENNQPYPSMDSATTRTLSSLKGVGRPLDTASSSTTISGSSIKRDAQAPDCHDLRRQLRLELLSSFRVETRDSKYGKLTTLPSSLTEVDHPAPDAAFFSKSIDGSSTKHDAQISDCLCLRRQLRQELLSSFRVALSDSKYGKLCRSSTKHSEMREAASIVEEEETVASPEQNERRNSSLVLERLRLLSH